MAVALMGMRRFESQTTLVRMASNHFFKLNTEVFG